MAYKKYKIDTYELSILEFEILQAKLNLSFALNDSQLKLFEEYEKLNSELLKKHESFAFKFATSQLKNNQIKKAP